MRLISVYETKAPHGVLYNLLAERPRENFISHEKMPSLDDHRAFVESRPFRFWYLIEVSGDYVGALECTDLNEIGVSIFRTHRRKGYGTQALDKFRESHEPLPAIPARRNGRWLANIAMTNEASKNFFWQHGFRPLQETWVAE